jgi:two-component system response regulator GlrR
MEYDWPGNVRELENTIEYGVVMAEGLITDDLVLQTKVVVDTGPQNGPRSPSTSSLDGPLKSLREARADFEKAYLIRVLESCDGKAAKAAEIAGKYRADFYDLLKKHGIKIQDFKSSE